MRAATIWDAVGRQSGWGGLMLAPDWYEQVETATQRRLLSAMMRFVSGAEYAPRAEALEGLRDRLVSGGGGTLPPWPRGPSSPRELHGTDAGR